MILILLLITEAFGCRLLPTFECNAGVVSKKVNGTSADACCLACTGKCHAYNYRESSALCELFEGETQRENVYEGCVGGTTKAPAHVEGPSIVLLVVESTDGRSWTPGYQNDVVPIPNIRKLQARGTTFLRHYANTPVCCPSRATLWSGRHAHRIPHESALGGFLVEGVWNNFEGLPRNYSRRLDQVLFDYGYGVYGTGKTDWVTGGHSTTVRLDAFTKYVDFDFDVNATGGFYTETTCADNATVSSGSASVHQKDWDATDQAVSWAKNQTSPFFLYTGHEIVHPPYATNQYWSSLIDRSKIRVPSWRPLMELHPCDFETTMRKGCAPSDDAAGAFYSVDRRREIRAVYYAMIAEFDAMVGHYVDELLLEEDTIFIVTSDHGDLQMEHQQFYKMSPYDASARVPMVVCCSAGRNVVVAPTQLIDLFPTVLELAGLPPMPDLDGDSLVPLLRGRRWTRDAVLTQFHGDDNGMSWVAIVVNVSNTTYKLVQWGTGDQHPPMLFDLDADPEETTNLASVRAANDLLVAELDAKLRSMIDYKKVARNVATYGRQSLERWIDLQDDWQTAIHAEGIRWDVPFEVDLNASFRAIAAFRNTSDLAHIRPCRRALNWQPFSSTASTTTTQG